MENKKTIFRRLIDARKKFKVVKKNSHNPYYRSSYADLAAVWDACKDGVIEQELFVNFDTQKNSKNEDILVTRIYDDDGNMLSSSVRFGCKDVEDPQKLGSSLTYAKRQGLSAALGLITDDDDDGNQGADLETRKQKEQAIKKYENVIAALKRMEENNQEITDEIKGKITKTVNEIEKYLSDDQLSGLNEFLSK